MTNRHTAAFLRRLAGLQGRSPAAQDVASPCEFFGLIGQRLKRAATFSGRCVGERRAGGRQKRFQPLPVITRSVGERRGCGSPGKGIAGKRFGDRGDERREWDGQDGAGVKDLFVDVQNGLELHRRPGGQRIVKHPPPVAARLHPFDFPGGKRAGSGALTDQDLAAAFHVERAKTVSELGQPGIGTLEPEVRNVRAALLAEHQRAPLLGRVLASLMLGPTRDLIERLLAPDGREVDPVARLDVGQAHGS